MTVRLMLNLSMPTKKIFQEKYGNEEFPKEAEFQYNYESVQRHLFQYKECFRSWFYFTEFIKLFFFSWSFLCFPNIWTNQLRSIFIFQTSKSDANIWKQLKSKLQEIFAKNWEDREVEDSHTIERILYLSRNILHIPPNAQDQNRAPGEDTVIFFTVIYDFIPNCFIES